MLKIKIKYAIAHGFYWEGILNNNVICMSYTTKGDLAHGAFGSKQSAKASAERFVRAVGRNIDIIDDTNF